MQESVREIAIKSKDASLALTRADTDVKNSALRSMALLLEKHCNEIINANTQDIDVAKKTNMSSTIIERLKFDEQKVQHRIRALLKIADLPDPVGKITGINKMPNGLLFGKMRVPLGVLLMIYEARPHVTVNGGAFALKSGNSIILKGGSEAEHCNTLIGELWRESMKSSGLPVEAIQVVNMSHDGIRELLKYNDLIDLVIPRGGKELVHAVVEQSRIPVIKHFEGICHVYIDGYANAEKALQIVLDSKLLMPSVCNAAETILVDKQLKEWLPVLISSLIKNGVEVRGCPLVCESSHDVIPASDDDWRTEYLDKIYSIKVVSGLDEAISHIRRFGSGHTDTIVTENYTNTQRFVQEVDSAVVMVNASTMFCDGESLGMGAEIGISTDKLHARGPMGLEELTSYKHIIFGQGHIMGEGWKTA